MIIEALFIMVKKWKQENGGKLWCINIIEYYSAT